MKKSLLLIAAVTFLLGANAQSFTDQFTGSGVVDTNSLYLQVGVDQGGNAFGPQGTGSFSLNQENNALAITSAGHGEWDFIRINFPTPINMALDGNYSDTIFIRAKADATNSSGKVFIRPMPVDGNNNDVNNQWDKPKRNLMVTSEWQVFKYTVVSWWSEWGTGLAVDSSAIETLQLGINTGFASYPEENVTEAFEGTLYIDYIQVGGSTPTADATDTKIEELNANVSEFSISPNPTSDIAQMNFYAEESADITFDIYSVTGSLVESISQSVNAGNVTFNYNIDW